MLSAYYLSEAEGHFPFVSYPEKAVQREAFRQQHYCSSSLKQFLSHTPSDFAVSSITVYELSYGAAKSKWGERTRRQMAMFQAPFTILSFDTEDTMIAGNIRAYLEAQGTPIGPYDIQIAAQALKRGLTLITYNIGEFNRVPKLAVEDWVE